MSGPLSLASLLLLMVAYASTTQREMTLARCLDLAASTIRASESKLSASWLEYQAARKSRFYVNNYGHELRRVWIEPSIRQDCYKTLDEDFGRGVDTEPIELASSFERRAEALRAAPLRFLGVEIASHTETSVFGTGIKVKLSSLTLGFQIILAPLLLLWLGSLYGTRYRETLTIAFADSIESLFPHFVNVYPAGRLPPLRRRSMLAYWLPRSAIISAIYALTRIALVSIVLLPAVGGYLVSLYLLPAEGLEWLFIAYGVLVCIFTVTVLFAELLPWHVAKFFPGPAT